MSNIHRKDWFLQMSINHFSTTQAFGLEWERWAAWELAGRGYSTRLLGGFFDAVDLVADGCPVEVKVSQPKQQWQGTCWRQRWQWDCARLPASFDHVVILVALVDSVPYPFIVPSWTFFGRGTRTPCITSHPGRYRGWLAAYRDQWGVVDQVQAIRSRRSGLQLPLPFAEVVC
jgi:hypothetical protein